MFLIFDYESELVELAEGLCQEGNFREARILLERAAKHFPASTKARLKLAQVLTQLGETTLSQELYQEIMLIDPSISEAKECLGRHTSLERSLNSRVESEHKEAQSSDVSPVPPPSALLLLMTHSELAY